MSAGADVLLRIRETHRQREDALRAELRLMAQREAIFRRLTGLTQEERAKVRRGKDTAAREQLALDEATAELRTAWLVEAAGIPKAARREPERRLEKMAMQLPVWEAWARGVRGLGALSLAQIVAEAAGSNPEGGIRSIADYRGPACLWKRFGLGLVDGERQRKVTDPEKAERMGYSPRRRAIMYTATVGLVNMNKGEYRDYYDAEKLRARAKWLETSAAHIDLHARRLLAKRLLRDLWRAWRAG